MIEPVRHRRIDLFIGFITFQFSAVFNYFTQLGIKINCFVYLEVQIDGSLKHFIVIYQRTDWTEDVEWTNQQEK